jgi:hypothetical protein
MDLNFRQGGILNNGRDKPYEAVGMLPAGDRASLAGVLLSALVALTRLLSPSDLPKVFDGLSKLALKIEHLILFVNVNYSVGY